MTLLVRDEADIVDDQITYHLAAGVDFVIATDNRSEDGTTAILERYERDGVLHLIREHGDDMRQDALGDADGSGSRRPTSGRTGYFIRMRTSSGGRERAR